MRRRLKSPPHSESRASLRVTSYFSRYMSFTVSRSSCKTNSHTICCKNHHSVVCVYKCHLEYYTESFNIVHAQSLTSDRPTMMRMRVSSSVPSPFMAALRRRAKQSCGFLAHLTMKQDTHMLGQQTGDLQDSFYLCKSMFRNTQGDVAVFESSCRLSINRIQNVCS